MRGRRERLLLEMEAAVASRFAPLLALCSRHGEANSTVRRGMRGREAGCRARWRVCA
jgi:hypothetical protein